jgi:hypothetical protein
MPRADQGGGDRDQVAGSPAAGREGEPLVEIETDKATMV